MGRKLWGRGTAMNTPTSPWGTMGSDLLRPASEMQLVTPQEEAIEVKFASLNMFGPSSNKRIVVPKGVLSPEAKAFVPSISSMDSPDVGKEAATGTVEAMAGSKPMDITSNPSMAVSTKFAAPASINVQIAVEEDTEGSVTEAMESMSIEDMAGKSGHTLPIRPTLCALPPKLPRWAHHSPSGRDVAAKGSMRSAGPPPGGMLRPGMPRMDSNASVMTTATVGSLNDDTRSMKTETGASWRGVAPGMAAGMMLAEKVQNEMQAEMKMKSPEDKVNVASPVTKIASSAVPVGSVDFHDRGSFGSRRSWGIRGGSYGSPARGPRRVEMPSGSGSVGSGLLGAVPMQAAGYR